MNSLPCEFSQANMASCLSCYRKFRRKNGNIFNLTNNSWLTAVEVSKIWIDLPGKEQNSAKYPKLWFASGQKLWVSFIEFVQLLLKFTHVACEGDWCLHLKCLDEMLPWFFAYDKTNYARYLPFYIQEMKCLVSTHQFQFNVFCLGEGAELIY